MDNSFHVAAVVFHAILAGVAVRLGYRAARAATNARPACGVVPALVLDLAVFLLCAALLAAAAGALTGDLFVALRLLAQALFGELVLLTAAVAAAHAITENAAGGPAPSVPEPPAGRAARRVRRPRDVPNDGPRLFRGLEVTWLEDRHAEIALPSGGSLVLVGLGTATSRTRDARALLRVVDAAPRGDLKIVLGHAPDFVAELAGRTPIDLALAGHTHGGQVVLPFLGPPLTLTRLPRRYAGDLHDYEGTPLHVSRGIGMERGAAPRVRFNCPPELCVLDLRY